jgi:hypothetical protein
MAKPNEPPAPRIDWRGADLRGVTLPSNMDYADLRACDLRGVDMSHRSFRYCDLRGAMMQGANCQHASFYGAKMQGVEAANADLRYSDLRMANLAGAYMQGARMPEPTAVQQPTPAPAAGNGNGIRGTLRNQLEAPAKSRPAPQQKKPEHGRHH